MTGVQEDGVIVANYAVQNILEAVDFWLLDKACKPFLASHSIRRSMHEALLMTQLMHLHGEACDIKGLGEEEPIAAALPSDALEISFTQLPPKLEAGMLNWDKIKRPSIVSVKSPSIPRTDRGSFKRFPSTIEPPVEMPK